MPNAAVTLALTTGAITGSNELLFAPLAGHGTPWKDFNWRIIPATAVFALALDGLSKLSPTLATGLGITAVLTALLAQFGNAASPLVNVAKVLGYEK
jgi:hypothetical protein